jgi:LPS sulfotransferase NodH
MVIAKKRQAYASWQAPVRALEATDYSGNEIAGTIENISMANAWWENFFAVFGIDPLRITYEQISSDPPGVTRRVAEYCGLTPCDPITMRPFEQEPLRPQSTAVNAQWEQRFLQDARAMRL